MHSSNQSQESGVHFLIQSRTYQKQGLHMDSLRMRVSMVWVRHTHGFTVKHASYKTFVSKTSHFIILWTSPCPNLNACLNHTELLKRLQTISFFLYLHKKNCMWFVHALKLVHAMDFKTYVIVCFYIIYSPNTHKKIMI